VEYDSWGNKRKLKSAPASNWQVARIQKQNQISLKAPPFESLGKGKGKIKAFWHLNHEIGERRDTDGCHAPADKPARGAMGKESGGRVIEGW